MKSVVGIILVGTNEKKWLQRAFTTILASEFQGKLEIVYVDNHSQDGSVPFVQENFPSVHLLPSPRNLGFSGANNKGIQRALSLNADYLFFVNPDTATPKNLIHTCVEFMQLHPDFGAIGPLQTVYGEELETTKPALNEWSRQALVNGERHLFYLDCPGFQLIECPFSPCKKIDHVLEHAYVQGAALFVRAKIFKETDSLDTTYHTFYEEVDLCRRIRWLGYRVGLVTNLFIQHQGGGSTSESLYKKKLMMRNKYYYVMTDPTWKPKQMAWLFKKWVKHDLQTNFPRHIKLLMYNLLWILFHLPKATYQRSKHKKLSQNRLLEIRDE